MKPEPLKNKRNYALTTEKFFYFENDVNLAVEWLKKEIRKNELLQDQYLWLESMIEEAFEDVAKG